jgi:hypothetical protein
MNARHQNPPKSLRRKVSRASTVLRHTRRSVLLRLRLLRRLRLSRLQLSCELCVALDFGLRLGLGLQLALRRLTLFGLSPLCLFRRHNGSGLCRLCVSFRLLCSGQICIKTNSGKTVKLTATSKKQSKCKCKCSRTGCLLLDPLHFGFDAGLRSCFALGLRLFFGLRSCLGRGLRLSDLLFERVALGGLCRAPLLCDLFGLQTRSRRRRILTTHTTTTKLI